MSNNVRRSRLTKEVRQDQILSAAAELFREKGYHAVSTVEIAQRAGVVEGTIFRYFATKRELVIKVAERAYENTIADYNAQLEGISGTWNRLRYMAWRHLKNILDEPAIHRLLQYEIKLDPEYRTTRIFELNRAYTRRTVEIIEMAIRSGEFSTDVPVRVIRDMIYGSVEHLVWPYIRGEGTLEINETADHITNLIYRGLVTRTPDAGESQASFARIEERLDRIEARLTEAASGKPTRRT